MEFQKFSKIWIMENHLILKKVERDIIHNLKLLKE